MLQITIPAIEMFDERTETFIQTKEQTLVMEHSLVSLAKWEAKWNKVFLSNRDNKTEEETIDYFRCMTITKNVDPNVYYLLSQENINAINEYIAKPMTATYFREEKGRGSNEAVTAELIYYWMISLNIPMECEKWHLNRLMTLIRVCSVKNQPAKKMSKAAIMRQNASLNAQRRAALHSKG